VLSILDMLDVRLILKTGMKIKEFLKSKEVDDRAGRGGTCFKIGDKYGETCYTVAFITP